MEEERDLKIEQDRLEYEISQGEKIQDNIDKLREKIHDLKNCKAGEFKKNKSKQKINIELSKTQLYSKINTPCDKALQYAGLDGLIDKSEFISELMDCASPRQKKEKRKL